MILWLQDKVEVLEYHSDTVRSASRSFKLPSVLRLKSYVRPYFSLNVKLSRQNLFLRDKYICQYCYKRFTEKKLTVDHIVPLSRGGKHEWTNVTTACPTCNNKKADRTPLEAKMKLLKKAKRPRWLPSREFHILSETLPHTWQPYIKSRTA